MPTIEQIINDILLREGPATDDPVDPGGRTAYGISERANPEAWADGKVTEQEAREIYERKYVRVPGFDRVEPHYLRAQLVDFGVNSGPQLATMKLQEILHVSVDGIIGPETLAAIDHADDRHTNNSLVASRVRMLGRIVSRNPSQLRFINGWLNRALEFLV